METVFIEPVDETFVKIKTNSGVAMELSEYLSFRVPGYQFMPKYRSGLWDGFFRLYNIKNSHVYKGLIYYIVKFCSDHNYKISIDESLYDKNDISDSQIQTFIDGLDLKLTPRDYQITSFKNIINNKRAVILSATGSGKSLTAYLIIKYLQSIGKRGLLVVPTTSLVFQMFEDFKSYGFDSEEHSHCIVSGKEKYTDKFLTISTWQSIVKLPKAYFKNYDFVIVDECHLADAKSITSIVERCVNAGYRIGMTGTLKGQKVHHLTLEGLFGPVFQATTTDALIKKGQLSDINIKCMVLNYPKEICKDIIKCDYRTEIGFLVENKERNNYIKDLSLSLDGNTLVLFQFVDKQGKGLYELIKKSTNRKVFFIYGSIATDDREKIRGIVENETDAIIVASYGTFSTGINIVNLYNIILASPLKSRIKNLQSIGRALRLNGKDKVATLFDISDDCRYGKKYNFSLKHFLERVKIYNSENFKFSLHKVDLYP